MYRKNHIAPKKYDDGEFFIGAIFDWDNELGGWWKHYPDIISYGYCSDEKKKLLYSDDYVAMKYRDITVGYFIGAERICTEGDPYLPPYGSRYELIDLAIEAQLGEEGMKLLLDYLLSFAAELGCSVLDVRVNEKFSKFCDMLRKRLNPLEHNGHLYCSVPNPRSFPEREHLRPYENDRTNILDLYFLFELGFDVGRELCQKELGANESITLNRRTGEIALPSNVKSDATVYLDEKSRNLIHLVCNMYSAGRTDELRVGVPITGSDVMLDAVVGKTVFFFGCQSVWSIDRSLALLIARQTDYTSVFPYYPIFNIEDRSFSIGYGSTPVTTVLSLKRR